MTPEIQIIGKRFLKAFLSTLASSIVLLPALTPNGFGDIVTYLHALLLAVVTALIMAIEKTISLYNENQAVVIPSPSTQPPPPNNQPKV